MDPQTERDRFPGVWKLISCERRSKDGEVSYPYGQQPLGRLTYDLAGRMSALLMRPGRSAGDRDGFTAYCGTFDVVVAESTVIHHVEVAMRPDWVGTDLRRTYRFEGNQLALKADMEDATTELLWDRA